MIDLFPFSGFPVAVLGLDAQGLKACESLSLSGAQVLAWDDEPARRELAAGLGIALVDPDTVDWREPVSMLVAPDVPHVGENAHPFAAAAQSAGCELLSDTELLARAQRDAAFVGVVSHSCSEQLLALTEHVFGVSGKDVETGGTVAAPTLALAPLDAGGTYVLDIPPGKADLTRSITFDCAILLDVGAGAWGPYRTPAESFAACRWVFHRQTEPKAAVLDVDDPIGAAAFDELSRQREQVLVPISGQRRIEHGAYVLDGVLYDDTGGQAVAVADLAIDGNAARQAAAVYAAALCLDVPRHAAMASLRSYFIETED